MRPRWLRRRRSRWAGARWWGQTVHVWQEGMTSVDLPPVYRDIVDVVGDAPAPLRAKQIMPRVGLAAVTLKIEGLMIL